MQNSLEVDRSSPFAKRKPTFGDRIMPAILEFLDRCDRLFQEDPKREFIGHKRTEIADRLEFALENPDEIPHFARYIQFVAATLLGQTEDEWKDPVTPADHLHEGAILCPREALIEQVFEVNLVSPRAYKHLTFPFFASNSPDEKLVPYVIVIKVDSRVVVSVELEGGKDGDVVQQKWKNMNR